MAERPRANHHPNTCEGDWAMAHTTDSPAQPELFEVPPTAKRLGKVYYGTDGANIKIGYSRSPRRRGGELKLTMLYTFEGNLADERQHHELWRRFRIRQEWFHADPALLSWLDRRVPRTGEAREVFRGLVFREAA